MTKLSDARKCALRTQFTARDRNVYPTQVVYEICDHADLIEADRNFCVLLVRGVAGYQIALDWAIDNALDKRPKMSAKVRDSLRISTYELLFLKKDAHVVVSQGVELVKSIAKSAAGLANAILHRVAEMELPNDFALQNGFPTWLFDYLYSLYGENGAKNFVKLSNDEPKLQFVANFLKPSKEPIVGVGAAIKAAKQGNVIIADKSAQAIAEEVALAMKQFGMQSLLEIGAGRGTKTALIESFLASIGHKISVHDVLDNSEGRLQKLHEKCKSCECRVTNVICDDATTAALDKKHDFVFIDAPCTGLGTLRRHPEIKSRITKQDILDSAELQLSILKNASKFVSSDGLIFYSTCSVAKEENEGVIERFLSSDAGKSFELDHVVRQARLTNVTDAHYCICLKNR